MHNSIPFFIVVTFLTFSCKKKTDKNCDFAPEHSLIACNAQDTTADVNGFTKIYYANGEDIKSEGNFTNGVRTGFWKYYFEDGNLLSEGNYTDGKANGFWNVYYDNGHILSQGEYKMCQRHGFWKYYYETNNFAVQFEGHYEENEKSSTWKMYNLDGSVEKEYDCY